MHPPGVFPFSLYEYAPPWQPFVTSARVLIGWPPFEAKAHFVREVRKKSRLESHGRIFLGSLIVQLVAFWLIFDADPTAVRLR